MQARLIPFVVLLLPGPLVAGPALEPARQCEKAASSGDTAHADPACAELKAALEALGRGCDGGAATDCAGIAEVLESKDPYVRGEAVKVLADQARLAQIAQDPLEDWEVRMAAVRSRRLRDPELIAAVARGADMPMVRREAAGRVEDQTLLALMARTDANALLRAEAVARMSDRSAVEQIASHDADPAVRAAAAARLDALTGATVTGTLLEESLGPMAGLTLSLGGQSAATDARGHFTFPEVAAGVQDLLTAEGAVLARAQGPIQVVVPASGELGLGIIAFRDDARVSDAYASLCETGGKPAQHPQADLLVFVQSGSGFAHSYAEKDQLDWTPPWPAALCLADPAARPAARTRVLRLSDGRAFVKRPDRSSVKDWLATIR